jgi:hypothetical protein
LSLAIGKEGQNARLAARLTGWRIDIRPDTPGTDVPVASAAPDAAGEARAGAAREARAAGGVGRAVGSSASRSDSAGATGTVGTVPGAADAPAR